MSRVAEAANSLAIAVAATAVGCTLVLELAPAHHPGIGQPAAPGRANTAVAHDGAQRPVGPGGAAAARAATAALGRRTGPRPGAAPPGAGRIRITAPAGPMSLRPNGSFPVTWTNTTGTEVDVWLSAAAGHGRIQRLALVSPKAGAAPAGEALVTLPAVPPGSKYALEVAAGNDTTRAFSRPFAITK
ncbi:hypothetical protein [Streptomyces sp. WZ-12]|uniref:hypothetical protein n=1 Tax=Streptomyces sp. WZ-12 TaxID=3030210 RepID=UPI002381340F|nr:hypothetical protein [Streptomyces sp. WZ-12]